MKATRHRSTPHPAPPRTTAAGPAGPLAALQVRLIEAEETLRAIRTGEVDAVVTAGKEGLQVFTLQGAERAYRVLIESMNEGALTLTSDKMILYANQCFARMVKSPLQQVTGSSFRRFLSPADRSMLRSLLKRAGKSGAKIQVLLKAGDGSQMPAQISVRALAQKGLSRATYCMVVSDMTAARQTEELLRALTNRVMTTQEVERGRVALELHDHITQLLCAILFRSQALVDELSPRGGPSMNEAVKLRDMLGETAREVERISHTLRPGVLDQLGLAAVLRGTIEDFADRTGLSVKLTCRKLTERLSPDAELVLYRMLQDALKSVEQHAHARHVTVCLTKQGNNVTLAIKDDGVGFDPDLSPAKRKGKSSLGLLGMRERVTHVGGTLTIKSARGAGTEILARVPLPSAPR